MTSPFSKKVARRHFLGMLGGAAVASRALADTSCAPVYGGQVCTSQVDFEQFADEAYQSQAMPEWCWAACISMVFAFYGHPVSQPRIVSEVYGAPYNLPAGYGKTIASQLNREWKDDNGKRFRSTLTAAFDYDAHVNTLNNVMLIRELDGEHPIIIGAGTHAMVLTFMQYFQSPMAGISVRRCGVFDPWPGRGARDLTPAEMAPMPLGGLRFVATARIHDLDKD